MDPYSKPSPDFVIYDCDPILNLASLSEVNAYCQAKA